MHYVTIICLRHYMKCKQACTHESGRVISTHTHIYTHTEIKVGIFLLIIRCSSVWRWSVNASERWREEVKSWPDCQSYPNKTHTSAHCACLCRHYSLNLLLKDSMFVSEFTKNTYKTNTLSLHMSLLHYLDSNCSQRAKSLTFFAKQNSTGGTALYYAWKIQLRR